MPEARLVAAQVTETCTNKHPAIRKTAYSF